MKEAIGTLGITNIVIFFIILFSGYLSMSVNQTKAYNVKNEVVKIIEKRTGLDDTSISEIREYLQKVGYRSTGSCENDEIGITQVSTSYGTSKANICVKCMSAKANMNDYYNEFPNSTYYKVTVFATLDVPIINNIFKIKLNGETKTIYYPSDGGIC